MKNTIFYYTGTGNSLWVARTLAEALGDTELVSIADWGVEKKTIDSDVIGFVFPVHMWGVPGRIIKFINEIEAGEVGLYLCRCGKRGTGCQYAGPIEEHSQKEESAPFLQDLVFPLFPIIYPGVGRDQSRSRMVFSSQPGRRYRE